MKAHGTAAVTTPWTGHVTLGVLLEAQQLHRHSQELSKYINYFLNHNKGVSYHCYIRASALFAFVWFNMNHKFIEPSAVLSKLREFIRISLTPTNFFNTLFIVIYLCILLFEQIIEYTTIDDFSISKK